MNSENIKKVTNQAVEQLVAALKRVEAKRLRSTLPRLAAPSL